MRNLFQPQGRPPCDWKRVTLASLPFLSHSSHSNSSPNCLICNLALWTLIAYSLSGKKKANVLTMTYKTPCDLAAIIVWSHRHRVYPPLVTRPLRLSSNLPRSSCLWALHLLFHLPEMLFHPDTYMANSPTSLWCFSKCIFSLSPFPANVSTTSTFPDSSYFLCPVLSLIFLFSAYFY